MEIIYPSEILRGARIELRKVAPSMASEMFRLVDGDRIRLARFLPWVEGMKTVADEEAYLKFAQNEWDLGHLFDYGVFADGEYAGSCGIHHMKWEHERAEIGYWIGGPFEGKGFISEAVRTIEKEIFRLGFHRVEIRCDPKNIRSANVPKKCGYHLEATLKDHAIEQGMRRDTMIWAKLATRPDAK